MCVTMCVPMCVSMCVTICVSMCVSVCGGCSELCSSQHMFMHAGVRVHSWDEYGVTYGVTSMQGFENKNGEYRTDHGPQGKCDHWMSQEHLADQVLAKGVLRVHASLLRHADSCPARLPRREVPRQEHWVPYRGALCPSERVTLDTCCSDETGCDAEYLAWL